MTIEDKKKYYLEFLTKILKKYNRLDDIDYILSASDSEVGRLLDMYEKDLKKALLISINATDINKEIDSVIKEFSTAITKFFDTMDLKNSAYRKLQAVQKTLEKSSVEAIIKSRIDRTIKARYMDRFLGVARSIAQDQRLKINNFNALKQLELMPLQRIEEIGAQRYFGVKIGKQGFINTPIKDLFDRMQAKYGRHDYVTYRDGKQMPLRSYVDMRITTTAHDLQRIGTMTAAASAGIPTLKINQTGTTDSCIYWENKIIFSTETAKTMALAQFKENKEVYEKLKNLQTLYDAESDHTHIFKYGCKHRVDAYPLTFLTHNDMLDEMKSNPTEKIPEKINETKLKAEILQARGIEKEAA